LKNIIGYSFICICISSFLTMDLLSQDISEAYINSLPDDIRADVLNQMADEKKVEGKKYRPASTKVDKVDSDQVNLGPQTEINDIGLKRFGTMVFRSMQSTFMPINVPNFNGNYIIDIGDTLQVQVVGSVDTIQSKLVDRDGSITISGIGKIFVSGLSLDKVSDLISNSIKSSMIGAEVFITLTSIRDIQILITGNASNPGIYTLSGNSNLLHALTMSGGVSDAGSFRSIQLIRDGKVVEDIDLYDIFIYGKGLESMIGLQSGDTIFISPYNKLVSITGGIRKPGIFEVIEGESLEKLIDFADGYEFNADKNSLRLERYQNSQVIVMDYNSNNISNVYPIDGDILHITYFSLRTVELKGAFKNPGKYIINDGEKLSTIVKRSGGYKDSAYTFGGKLFNIKARKLQELNNMKLYSDLVKFISSNTNALAAISADTLPLLLEEFKASTPDGRVQAEFDLDMISENSLLDTYLSDGDVINMPFITQQVYVFGEVANPGATRHISGSNLSSYINSKGGYTNYADNRKIVIVSPNGDSQFISPAGLFKLTSTRNYLIYPGSVIYVPREIGQLSGLSYAAFVSPVISNVALTLASLASLQNNN